MAELQKVCFTLTEPTRLLNKTFGGTVLSTQTQIEMQNPAGEPYMVGEYYNGMILGAGTYCFLPIMYGCVGDIPSSYTGDDFINPVPYDGYCCFP